jgi:hypothetical protein
VTDGGAGISKTADGMWQPFCPALKCQGKHSRAWRGPAVASVDEAEVIADQHDAEHHDRPDLAPDQAGTPSLFGCLL